MSIPDIPNNFEECVSVFRDHLKDSVRLRLRSDVPVGCYLSGGIDSSAISWLVRDLNQGRFKTFSIGFTEDAYDESDFQDTMVALLRSEHVRKTIDLDQINRFFLESAYHFERPVFRTAPLPLFLLSRIVQANGIKVVLTGEAADEILCGYDTFKEIQLLRRWEAGADRKELLSIIKDLYPHLGHYQDESKLGFLEMYYEGFLGKINGPAAGLAIRIHNNQVLANYFNKDWGISVDIDRLDAELEALIPDEVANWPVIRRNQYLEMKTLLSGYLLSSQGDRMAMAHSVEGRFPFLDHRLVDWAFHLPETYKLNGLSAKYLLKEAFRGELPEKILNRPKRPYMAPDLIAFFPNGSPTETAAHFLNPERLKEYGIFDPKMVMRLLAKIKRRGTKDIGYRDNMLITYIISSQMVAHWIRNPKRKLLPDDRKRICIVEKND